MSSKSARQSAHRRYVKTAPQMTKDTVHFYAPALGWYTDEVLFGRNWSRPELCLRDRSIVTISALIAGAHTKQMVGHFTRGLKNGVKPKEIQEIITHLAFHVGWPYSMSAVAVMESVFKDQGIEPDQLGQDDNALLPAGSEVSRHRAVVDELGEILPAMVAFDGETVNGDLWRRPELRPRDRSLSTLSAMIAAGEEIAVIDELPRCLENGLVMSEIREVMTHLAFYVGWPRVKRCALAVKPLLAG